MVFIECMNDDHFNRIVGENVDKIMIVDFTATWCGPCQKFAPQFKAAATMKPAIPFVKVDIDRNPGTAAMYGVRAVPTVMAMQAG